MENKQKGLTRRDFIRGTVGATLAVSVLRVPWAKGSEKAVGPSLVTVVRDKNVMDAGLKMDSKILQSMLDRTVLQVTGKRKIREAWADLVKPDDIVGLVPTPFLNPTHEELVDVVKASLMKEVGIPEKNIIMAQGGKRRPGRCTALISMPALKGHWLTGIGTVIKNYIMYSGRPSRYHAEKSAKLGEIWLIPEVKGKTQLVLVDAIHPLCDKGPQPDPRYKWAYNGLLAGTDPVAVETVCLRILNQKRYALRGEPWPISPPPICVAAADKAYGLGTSKMEKIKILHSGWEEDLLLG
ncbi:MAG: DUF362 domain-containing protein [Gammaproteobacteria bacterium]|nr:DUF362 domain-containing protein [Gammaproteobacteria bacterium]